MKRVRINRGKVGLVFKSDNYVRPLKEGIHWLSFTEEVRLYDTTKPFYPFIELTLLLQDKKLANMLEVVEVKDEELVMQYENGNFTNVLTPGRYAFWKGVMDYAFVKVNVNNTFLQEDVDIHIIHRKEIVPYIRVEVIASFERGLLFVDGKFVKELEAGTHHFWRNNNTITVQKVDLRQQQQEISGQEILTKDKAAIRLNFFAQYKVVDIKAALLNNKDFEKQLYILIQLALREYVSTFTLDELLDKKDAVGEYVLQTLAPKTKKLGVEICDTGIRDIILPGEVKDIMNKVLIAQKTAQANIITRREETASTRSLLNTAKLMEDNTMLFKLKEMEYVEKIADKINTISVAGGGQVLSQLKEMFTQ